MPTDEAEIRDGAGSSKLPSQHDTMRRLYTLHKGNREVVCAAYAQAERDGLVARASNLHSQRSEIYAAALWRDGHRKGKAWLLK